MSSFLFPDCHIFRKSLLEKHALIEELVIILCFFPYIEDKITGKRSIYGVWKFCKRAD